MKEKHLSPNPHKFTALDPELLSTPYEVQTNWHVLTGAACTGKTTLIDMLADLGYQTIPEAARQFIDKELECGRLLDEIFSDPDSEEKIDEIQMKAENGLIPSDLVFLDRALPDSITFRRHKGMDPNKILPECFHHRYASVFVLDRLPLELDGARLDDEVLGSFLDEWLTRDYCALGYDVIRVPVLSPEERLAFLLERVSEQVLI